LTDYLPPRHSDADRLADAWRYALADGDDAAFWIRQALRLGHEPVRCTLNRYRWAVRAASEYEERMTAAGIPFQRRARS
jgi:hypothetical protein